VILLAALLLVARVGSADEEDPRYRELVRQGVEDYTAHRYEEAAALFEQAYAVRPSARALRGLAKARFELQRYALAIDAIDRSLASTVDPLTPQLADEVRELRARAARYVASISLRLTPAEAEALLDGRALEHRSFFVEVGPHTLDVRAPGYVSERRTIDAPGGGAIEVTVALRKEAEAAPASPPRPPPPARIAPYLAGGAVALGIGATVASIIWLVDRKHAADACAREGGTACENARSIGAQYDAAKWATAGASIATLSAAAFLVLTLRATPERRAAFACSGLGCDARFTF
jgi:tetratricopeptide (TPR) repeat protein